jgi:hypothetical protein
MLAPEQRECEQTNGANSAKPPAKSSMVDFTTPTFSAISIRAALFCGNSKRDTVAFVNSLPETKIALALARAASSDKVTTDPCGADARDVGKIEAEADWGRKGGHEHNENSFHLPRRHVAAEATEAAAPEAAEASTAASRRIAGTPTHGYEPTRESAMSLIQRRAWCAKIFHADQINSPPRATLIIAAEATPMSRPPIAAPSWDQRLHQRVLSKSSCLCMTDDAHQHGRQADQHRQRPGGFHGHAIAKYECRNDDLAACYAEHTC